MYASFAHTPHGVVPAWFKRCGRRCCRADRTAPGLTPPPSVQVKHNVKHNVEAWSTASPTPAMAIAQSSRLHIQGREGLHSHSHRACTSREERGYTRTVIALAHPGKRGTTLAQSSRLHIQGREGLHSHSHRACTSREERDYTRIVIALVDSGKRGATLTATRPVMARLAPAGSTLPSRSRTSEEDTSVARTVRSVGGASRACTSPLQHRRAATFTPVALVVKQNRGSGGAADPPLPPLLLLCL